ncbi:MAG: murein biosynthesis integral membrane protein MurJ [Desulfuromonadaceae bacterium]|nr:murein biosynthesis integral membrane protein MurJ [Desulfuromonadaceae bacterium]
MSRVHMLAATAVLGFSTLLSRCAGLVRDMVIAAMFGASYGTDAFFIAFTIPNLLRRFFAEGSLTAAFVPVFSGVKSTKGHHEAVIVARQCWSLLIMVVGVLTALGILFAPAIVTLVGHGFANVPGKIALTIDLTRVMFPYIFFVSLLALVTGVLNVYGHYFMPAFSPVLLNLSMIVSAVFLSKHMTIPIESLAWGVIVGGVLQLLISLPVFKHHGFRIAPTLTLDHPAVKRITLLMLPGVIGVAIYQINVVVTRLLASFLEQGSVSWLYYSQRLFEFPQGIFIASLAQALLPAMSRQAADGQESELLDSLRYGLNLIIIITLPAAVGLAMCSHALFSQLFMGGEFSYTDVSNSAAALIAYAPGLFFVGISRIIVPLFHARQDTRTPVVVSFWTLLINAGAGLFLMQYFSYIGLAAALSLASCFNAMALFMLLRGKLTAVLALKPLMAVLLRAGMATILMGFAVQGILQYGEWEQGFNFINILSLGAAVGAGVVVYVLACLFMGLKEVTEIWRLVGKRLHR